MINSLEDILHAVPTSHPIVILYSGGLDGTYLIQRLKTAGYGNLHAFHGNLNEEGQKEMIRQRLSRLGIAGAIPADLTEEFVEEYVAPAIYCCARYLGGYPISASLSRPIIAKHGVRYAESIGAAALLHTSNSSQNSLRRFNQSIAAQGYKGLYGSPFQNTHISRIEKMAFLTGCGMAFDMHMHSEDSNIWCREFEYGDFDDVENIRVPEDAYLWTRKAPVLSSEDLTIGFEAGIPVSLNGRNMPLQAIITEIRYAAGKYGIGRFMGLEEIATGQKVLEIRETPSGALLIDAYRQLESATCNSAVSRTKMAIEQIWINEAVEGRWFAPLRSASHRFCQEIAGMINGSVTYRLMENCFTPISVRSKSPNYISNRDVFEARQ